MVSTYFTFGSNPCYPYGINDYVLIEAATMKSAIKEFMARFPNPDSPDTVNCAFYYSENEWKKDKMRETYYGNNPPALHITVAPAREEIRDIVTSLIYLSDNAFVLGERLCDAFPGQSDTLRRLVGSIKAHELSNVDLIMDKLEELDMFKPSQEKEGVDKPRGGKLVNITEPHEVAAYLLLEEAVAESEGYISSLQDTAGGSELDEMASYIKELASQISLWEASSGYPELAALSEKISTVISKLETREKEEDFSLEI